MKSSKRTRPGGGSTRTKGKSGRSGHDRRARLSHGAVARRITATEAARTFSDLLNRVHYRGETVVVERGGSPICEIAPAKPLRFTLSDLVALLHSAPKPDAAYWDTLERITRDQPALQPSPWAR